MRFTGLFLLALTGLAVGAAGADDENVVFRSDVALIRVDAQVVDRDNRAITGLRAGDFVLRDEGKVQQIRNFASEDMPLDILFLLDVSASMRPHVERIASAAREAMMVLGEDDRFAIMVFDRSTRLRMPFQKGRNNVEREFNNLLRQETFHGGTDITRGMYDATQYISRSGRRDARRAIVILTDDETQRERDDEGVLRALARGETVMSALIAPDAMGTHGGGMGGRYPRTGGGGGWPGGGPSVGGPLGGIILGRRGGYGGRGPATMGTPTHSAGTAEIARRSGGDSMHVDDASALETTLARLRQRYALHFYLPATARRGQERNIEVELASAVRRRYPDAEVRFRRVYMVPEGANTGAVAAGPQEQPVVVTRASSTPDEPAPAASSGLKRRRAVNEDGSMVNEAPQEAPQDTPAQPVMATPVSPAAAQPAPAPPRPVRGWRRVDDPSQQPPPARDPKPSATPPPG